MKIEDFRELEPGVYRSSLKLVNTEIDERILVTGEWYSNDLELTVRWLHESGLNYIDLVLFEKKLIWRSDGYS